MQNLGEVNNSYQGEHWRGYDFVEELDVRSVQSTAVSEYIDQQVEALSVGSSIISQRVSDYVPVNTPPPEHDADMVNEDAPVCPSDAAWDDARIYQEDIEYARKEVPTIPVKFQEYFLNIAIVGGCYDGRSSLQKNLVFSNVKDVENLNDASGASWKEFGNNPNCFMNRLAPIENKKDHVRVYINIQNTPGLDSKDERQLAIFEAFLKGKIVQYYKMDTNVMVERENMRDERVDALLYVLPPQLVRDQDIVAMKRFAAAGVAVLPVVNKADVLQDNQREDIRADLIEKMGSDLFQFSRQCMGMVGAHQDAPPFFTVLGNEVDEEVHPYWLVRKYKWGKCEAFRSRDSDLKFLKHLIFEAGFQELKDNTDRQYFNLCRTWTSSTSEANPKVQESVPFYPPIPTPSSAPPPPPPAPQQVHASTSTPSVQTTSTSAQSNLVSQHVNQEEKVTQKSDQVQPYNQEEKVTQKSEKVQPQKEEEEEEVPQQPHQVKQDQKAVFGSPQVSDTFDFSNHMLMRVSEISPIKGQNAFRLTLSGDSDHMSLRVGNSEGGCLRNFVKGDVCQRPNVYEVWQQSLQNAGQRVVRLVIKEFRDTIFYAALEMADASGKIVQSVDARPSDAINLAVRSNAPIYVANAVMEQVLRAQNRA